MPISHTIDLVRRRVCSRAWGVLTEDDVRIGGAALRADPSFDPGYSQLMDLRDVTEMAMSSQSIAAIARRSNFTPGVRRAFVVAHNAQFGVARMFATYSESKQQTVRVFRNEDDARGWLDEEAAG